MILETNRTWDFSHLMQELALQQDTEVILIPLTEEQADSLKQWLSFTNTDTKEEQDV